MNDEFKWIEKVERGELSLVGLINANRWMEETIGKRKRTQKIALLVLVVVFGAVAAYVAYRILDPRSSRVDKDFAMILGIALAAMVVLFGAVIFSGIRSSTLKPYKRYKAALAAGYPGIDTSSEAAMKSYVWNYVDEPKKLLGNLCRLIERESGQRKIRGEHDEVGGRYTPAERVVLDVWYTNNVARELFDWERYAENEINYLTDAVERFRTIGAEEEASVWADACTLFTELQNPDEESYEVLYRFHEDIGEVDYSEHTRNRLLELEERLAECRPDTEAKLYDFAMQNKILFAFGGAEQTM